MRIVWNDPKYYGMRSKRYFANLDSILKKLFQEALEKDTKIDNDTLEQILRITSRQNHIIYSITRLIETMDLTQRLLDMEKLIHSIPAEVFAQARGLDDWRGR